MALRIYDTLTREKREFVSVHAGKVGMYVCGMTVQDRPHVGHMRASISGEVMRRYLEHRGFQVTYVYNFTDVDDKIIEKANAEGVDYGSVSERNIDAYLRFADLHNILRATHYPRATRHIQEIFDLIRTLIEKPTGMTHSALPPAVQKAGHLSPGGVRLSIGIEDPGDIIHDLREALKRC